MTELRPASEHPSQVDAPIILEPHVSEDATAPRENILDYDVTLPGEKYPVGRLILAMDESKKEVSVDWIAIESPNRGYGASAYRRVLSLPSPNGPSFTQSGYRFVSSAELNHDSIALWEALVGNGEAKKLGEKSYEFIPRPEEQTTA